MNKYITKNQLALKKLELKERELIIKEENLKLRKLKSNNVTNKKSNFLSVMGIILNDRYSTSQKVIKSYGKL